MQQSHLFENKFQLDHPFVNMERFVETPGIANCAP